MTKDEVMERFRKQKEALRKGDLLTVKRIADECRKELEEKGMVKAHPVFGWTEKEWLDKALNEGVIHFDCNYGYLITADELVDDEVVGYRGRTPITQTKTVLSTARFKDFLRRYEEFKSEKLREEHSIRL